MTRILCLTSPELGQCNVHIAVTSALKELYPSLEVHLASYEKLRSKCPSDVEFRVLRGTGIEDAVPLLLGQDDPEAESKFTHHKASLLGCARFYSHMSTIIHPEKPSEFLETATDVTHLIERLQPDLCVVDPLFDAGTDVCRKLGRKFVTLSPLGLNEEGKEAQGSGIFRWPFTGIGYRYPMSTIDTLKSGLALVVMGIYILLFDLRMRKLNEARHAAGYEGVIGVLGPRKEPLLCMSSSMELEYPGIKPANMLMCGPILLPSKPISQIDGSLHAWLREGPVILIVLGSHVMMNEKEFYAFKAALKIVMIQRPEMRVLWKLMKSGDYATDMEGLTKNRIKIMNWLDADPRSILETGTVALSINHGGSSSYHEALITGTPQVICSPWADCHDKGRKVEYLGVGKWGNYKASPSYEEKELTEAILEVIGISKDDTRGIACKAAAIKAQALIKKHIEAELSRYPAQQVAEVDGRYVAANIIADQAKDAPNASTAANGP